MHGLGEGREDNVSDLVELVWKIFNKEETGFNEELREVVKNHQQSSECSLIEELVRLSLVSITFHSFLEELEETDDKRSIVLPVINSVNRIHEDQRHEISVGDELEPREGETWVLEWLEGIEDLHEDHKELSDLLLSKVVFSSADIKEEVVEESEERSLIEVFSVELVVLGKSQADALEDLLEDIILIGVNNSLEKKNDKLGESINIGEVHSRIEVRFVISIQSVGR